MVKKIFESKPEKQYIVGIDATKKGTQQKLINAISNGIGTGLTDSVDYPEPNTYLLKKGLNRQTPLNFKDWKIPLLLNLWIKPSPVFVGGVNEEGEAEEVDFNWHCRSGLKQNI